MKRDGKIAAIGLTFLIAGVAGCEDSATDPTPFVPADRHSVIDVQVENGTAFGVDLVLELATGPGVAGAEETGEEIALGTVSAGAAEVFILEPSVVAASPVRFIARSGTGEQPIMSEWMWLGDGARVQLLVTPLRVIRTDAPDEDLPQHCPGEKFNPCW